MSTHLLAWLLSSVLPAANQTLDEFQYVDAATAQAAWTASSATPKVETVTDGRRTVLQISAPFATDATLPRTIIDRNVELDLTVPSQFRLEVAADQPQACSQVSLYFRSGDGWYGGSGRLAKAGWTTLQFNKSDFRIEGQPAGWDQVDGIRVSFWRTADQDAVIRIRQLSAAWNNLALIVPSDDAGMDAGELSTAKDVADRVSDMIDELGLASDRVPAENLSAGTLGPRTVAIVAYHPRLEESAVDALTAFIGRGGKVFICYSLPPRLGEALGFSRGEYHRQSRDGQFAEIRFGADARDRLPGLPSSARQASWNIVDAKPLAPDAAIIGSWFDDAEKATGHAALLVSPRGAFFSHILLDDDRGAKRQMLAALLGSLDPTLWRQMADSELKLVESVGHLTSVAAVKQWVQNSGMDQATPLLDEGLRLHTQATAAFTSAADGADAAATYAAIVVQARQARSLLAQAYLLAQPSSASEGRAVWNHSGTGAYDGDWERSARELKAAGFNMVIPNLLWAGRAHYASDVLPRSRTFEQYGDQIAQCVSACKPLGIEVHVWKVNWNLSGAPRDFVQRMQQDGRTQVSVRGEALEWLCPSHPANQKLELDSLIEVARNYDVDGLHFDYIRYPHGDSCYCDGCRERFEAETGVKVTDWPDDCYRGEFTDRYRDWRCEQITRLVAAVHREAKQVKPDLKISAAVFGAYPDCRRSVGQDWPVWIKAGYLDFVCPMDYTGSDETFQSLVQNQLNLVEGRIPVYPGIGATASRVTLSADRVVGQIHYARELGAAGFTIFNFQAGTAREILPGVGEGAARTSATTPHR